MPLTLRPYQEAGVKWLKQTRRGILADSFGLGKSLQAVHAAQTPVLIVCPTYLVEQWADVLAEERPGESVAVAVGSREERLEAIAVGAMWTICNIEMLRTYARELAGHPYETFIIDEAHHVRGRNAKQSQVALALAKRIPNVYLLTATPMVREPDDFYQELAILDSKRFSSYHRFVGEFCVLANTGYGTKVMGAKNKEGLIRLLKPYMLRRTYKGTGMELPPTVKYPVRIRPSRSWQATYKRLKKEYRVADITFENAGAMVRELRRMTFDLKLDAAKQILEDHPDTIFYVYYRDSAHLVGDLLGLPVVTGALAPSIRLQMAKAGGALVATISSLKEGCDLTHLTNVCFLEQSYLPGDRTQAIARLVRWSENVRPVGVFDVTVKDSIDETITRTVVRRQATEELILRAELARP